MGRETRETESSISPFRAAKRRKLPENGTQKPKMPLKKLPWADSELLFNQNCISVKLRFIFLQFFTFPHYQPCPKGAGGPAIGRCGKIDFQMIPGPWGRNNELRMGRKRKICQALWAEGNGETQICFFKIQGCLGMGGAGQTHKAFQGWKQRGGWKWFFEYQGALGEWIWNWNSVELEKSANLLGLKTVGPQNWCQEAAGKTKDACQWDNRPQNSFSSAFGGKFQLPKHFWKPNFGFSSLLSSFWGTFWPFHCF